VLQEHAIMKRTLFALGCALALAGGSAFAQQQGSGPRPAGDTSGPTLTEKAREAAETIGEKTKAAVEKVKDMAQESARKSKAGDDQKAARSGPGDAQRSRIERMQAKADADFRLARSKCEPIEPRAQKTVCEKQAAAAHASAELRIAQAEAAAQEGKTSTMGAGKAAK
jgi:hypothetical protein